jgi:hypothetical protein
MIYRFFHQQGAGDAPYLNCLRWRCFAHLLLEGWTDHTGNQGILCADRLVVSQSKQLAAAAFRECGRQNDDGAFQLAQSVDECPNERAGIEVVAVDLVQDHHLAGETELTNEEMFGCHDAQQRLVNRADAKRSKQSPLG